MSASARASVFLLAAVGLGAGCAGPAATSEPAAPASFRAAARASSLAASAPRVEGPASDDEVRLTLRRVGPDGDALPLRAEVWDRHGLERLAAVEGRPPEPVDLEPGAYRLTFLEDPGPFGVTVWLEEGRPVEVLVCSDPAERSHAVAVETLRRKLGNGVTLVERQIFGFGWGPLPPLPAVEGDAPAAAAAEGGEGWPARPSVPTAGELEAWRARSRDASEGDADDDAVAP